jgi:hypothetical protein
MTGKTRIWTEEKQMGENHDRILTEYRCAGFGGRLYMYLQFRELRSEFSMIERNELNTGFSANVESPGGDPKGCEESLPKAKGFFRFLKRRVCPDMTGLQESCDIRSSGTGKVQY